MCVNTHIYIKEGGGGGGVVSCSSQMQGVLNLKTNIALYCEWRLVFNKGRQFFPHVHSIIRFDFDYDRYTGALFTKKGSFGTHLLASC